MKITYSDKDKGLSKEDSYTRGTMQWLVVLSLSQSLFFFSSFYKDWKNEMVTLESWVFLTLGCLFSIGITVLLLHISYKSRFPISDIDYLQVRKQGYSFRLSNGKSRRLVRVHQKKLIKTIKNIVDHTHIPVKGMGL